MDRAKSAKLLLSALLCCLMLSGCWDRQEIEDQTSVAALAVDKHEQGIQVTIQVPIAIKIIGSGGGGGGEGGQDAVQLYTASGQDLTDAFKNMQKQLNRELSLDHMRLVVISEAFARDGIEDITDALGRLHNVRRRLWPMVVEGEAAKALEADPKLEQIPAVYMIDMIDNEVKRDRMPGYTMGRFLSKLSDEAEQPLLNLFKVTDKTINWTGIALFRDEHMVGKLNEEDSWALLQIREGEKGFRVSSPCPNGGVEEVTFEPRDAKRTVTFVEQPFGFKVHVELEGIIVEETCEGDLSNTGTRKAIERELKQIYEERARRTIRELQRKKTDVTKLGTHIRAFYPAVWGQIDWQDRFPTTDIKVTYDIRILGTGAKFK